MNNLNKNLKENPEEEPLENIEEISEVVSNEGNEAEEIKESDQQVKEVSIDEVSKDEFGIDEKGDTIEEKYGDIEDEYIERENLENLDESVELKPLESEPLEEVSLEVQLREFHRNLIEASLYAAGRPLSIEEISNKLEISKKEVEELINLVAFDYMERSTALVIAQIGDRYQMQIKPEYTEKVSKFAKGGAIAERYLRTLTIIALKQPILKSTVVKLRGSGAYEHVKYLIDNGFIDAVKKGRTHELTTTDKYSDMFGLPKDKIELKRVMIKQLGVEEVTSSEQPEEIEDEQNIDQEKLDKE
ncbi:MAG: SMC-Scp complex subunit ScpB [Promethearchaeota archaeon]